MATEQIITGPDALEHLGRYVADKGWRRILVVDDANTHEALGRRLAADLAAAGCRVTQLTYPERKGLLADEEAARLVLERLEQDEPVAAAAVGSGVLNDLTRYATFAAQVPYVSVPTAASMDGYASSVAAMQFDGMKVTHPAHAPLAVFADPGVLAAAPPDMARWGLGDLLGKASATFDWYLSHELWGEALCPAVAQEVREAVDRCLAALPAILDNQPEGLAALVEGLIGSGLAMAKVGSSRPASGCEHHASHFWDLCAYRGLRPHAPHGLQVGYATRFCLKIQHAIVDRLADPALPRPALPTPPPGEADPGGQRWLGPDTESLAAVRTEKRSFYASHRRAWPSNATSWAGTATRLRRAAANFADVEAALEQAGIPATAGYLDVGTPMLEATWRFANRLRARYTALDFLEGTNIEAAPATG
ncbi:MAG: sn-glycerol-1-phosphate dehydrogenase [Acidimicrobiales bacterium]